MQAIFCRRKGGGKDIPVIGHFPFTDALRKGREKPVGDLEKWPRPGDVPEKDRELYLPLSQIVVISSTTLINHTLSGTLGFVLECSLKMLLGSHHPRSRCFLLWHRYHLGQRRDEQGTRAEAYRRRRELPAVEVIGLYRFGCNESIEDHTLDADGKELRRGVEGTGSPTMRDLAIVIKGAGEMASGIAHRLYSAGLTKILMTDKRTCCQREGRFPSPNPSSGERSAEG